METLQTVHDRIKQHLRQQAPRIVQLMAQTGLTLVTLRVQEYGVRGKAYSTNQIPTFFFEGRELNSAGKAYLEENDLGTWGAFRKAQGLTDERVNLTYTGGMFRALHVAGGGVTGTLYTASIVASDEESTAKVLHNIARYGDFLVPIRGEQNEVQQVGKIELDKVIAAGLKAA